MKKLLISDVAKEKGVTHAAVLIWIKKGLFPGAKLNETGVVPFWEIPAEDVDNFKSPKPGRPRKNKKKSLKGELAA